MALPPRVQALLAENQAALGIDPYKSLNAAFGTNRTPSEASALYRSSTASVPVSRLGVNPDEKMYSSTPNGKHSETTPTSEVRASHPTTTPLMPFMRSNDLLISGDDTPVQDPPGSLTPKSIAPLVYEKSNEPTVRPVPVSKTARVAGDQFKPFASTPTPVQVEPIKIKRTGGSKGGKTTGGGTTTRRARGASTMAKAKKQARKKYEKKAETFYIPSIPMRSVTAFAHAGDSAMNSDATAVQTSTTDTSFDSSSRDAASSSEHRSPDWQSGSSIDTYSNAGPNDGRITSSAQSQDVRDEVAYTHLNESLQSQVMTARHEPDMDNADNASSEHTSVMLQGDLHRPPNASEDHTPADASGTTLGDATVIRPGILGQQPGPSANHSEDAAAAQYRAIHTVLGPPNPLWSSVGQAHPQNHHTSAIVANSGKRLHDNDAVAGTSVPGTIINHPDSATGEVETTNVHISGSCSIRISCRLLRGQTLDLSITH